MLGRGGGGEEEVVGGEHVGRDMRGVSWRGEISYFNLYILKFSKYFHEKRAK